MGTPTTHAAIHYGKGQVTFYRTYAQPLSGLTPIPESAFVGRPNILFALDVDVEVFGNEFLPAYTEGDNSRVVPTDTMKNFIHAQALAYQGATLEGFLYFLGQQFLATYSHMASLRLTGREQPFPAVQVPGDGTFEASPVLFARSHDEHATAVIELVRAGDGVRTAAHQCGRAGLQLIKVTGSAFTRFVRDAHTTLPERVDRPLFIYLDVHWRYADAAQMLGADPVVYVPAEQVRDLLQVVFHSFVSQSIQHLIYEMGNRLLARFPQLAEVSFAAQNRLWDTSIVSETDERIKVYCDPRPPYGIIGLTLTRDDSSATQFTPDQTTSTPIPLSTPEGATFTAIPPLPLRERGTGGEGR